jgi:hypothetical protein
VILYSIDQTDAGESITCLLCRSTSHNLTDVRERYCGRCHRFLRDLETAGLSKLLEGAETLRPDLSLDELRDIVGILGSICSPDLNPHAPASARLGPGPGCSAKSQTSKLCRPGSIRRSPPARAKNMRRELTEAAEKAGWSEEYLAALNAELHCPDITAIGAYCMGVVEGVFRQYGRVPNPRQLHSAAQCGTVKCAVDLANRWLRYTPRRKKS